MPCSSLRFQGVKQEVIGEGTHFMIPWVQRPILFDIRAKPKNVPTITGNLNSKQNIVVPDPTGTGTVSYQSLVWTNF